MTRSCSAGSLRFATTWPITRAICMALIRHPASGIRYPADDRCSRSSLHNVDGVDDADDGGVDGTIVHARRHARRAAADDEHGLTDTRIHGVDGDQMIPFGFAFRIHRAN